MLTPNAQRFRDDILARFRTRKIESKACRKISGTSSWSQHSWENALDIFPVDRAEGDKIYARYRTNWNVRTSLWQVKDHYDHIHLDFWPYGYSTPPCAGGRLLVKHHAVKGGVINQSWTPDFPFEAPPVEPPSTGEDMVKEGDQGLSVAFWQRILYGLQAYKDIVPPEWRPPKAGDTALFDKAMVAAVKKFQKRPGVALAATGVIDMSTASALVERTHNLELHKHNQPPHDKSGNSLERAIGVIA